MPSLRSFDWHVLPQWVKGALRADGAVLRAKGRGDPWLQRWVPLLLQVSQAHPVLEIGCGPGEDTRVMIDAGLAVTAFDLSAKAIAKAARRVPAARFHCQDVRDPFPLVQAGAVVASLSLHYFDWPQTLEIIGRIGQTLVPGGVLLCRMNSTKDVNFGAQGHAEIARNFFLVHGEPKRFFDEASLREAFVGWHVLAMEEKTSHRFGLPKVVWELALQRP